MTTPVRFSFARRRRGVDRVWPTTLAIVVALTVFVVAHESNEERVAQLWVAATVLEDGGAEVVEVIDYDFGADSRHGIYRDIPDLRTSDPVRVSSPTAPDDRAVRDTEGSTPQVRIGDPVRTVTGLHRYVLRYTLDDVSSGGRVAWDAVGTEWDVPIEDVEVHVVAAATLEGVACTTGTSGSTDPCAASEQDPGHAVATVGHLDPGEGMTVSAPLGEPLGAASIVPAPPATAESRGVSPLALALIAGLLVLVAGSGTALLLRRIDRHHAPSLGLPGHAPGEKARVRAHELEGYAAPSSRLPGGLTPSQGAILLGNNGLNFWDMAPWLAEQAAAGTIDFEPAGDADGGKKSVVMVRRRPGTGFVGEVLDEAFGGRDRVTLGRYDAGFARAATMVREHLATWRETSGLWNGTLGRRAAVAKRLGLFAGLAGLVAVFVGSTWASTDGRAALAVTGLGSVLAASGSYVRLGFWGDKVLTAEGTAAWLEVESLRKFLTRLPSGAADEDLPIDRFGEYTAWAIALEASEQWKRLAARITDTTRTPVQAHAGVARPSDPYYWVRHATLVEDLARTCHASSSPPWTSSTSSSPSGGSTSSGYRGSGSVGSGSGGGGGGSW